MILIVDMCWKKDSLSKEEFVKPIEKIVGEESRVVHFLELNESHRAKADKIILCGTALADNEYLNHIEKFLWLKDTEKSILGICAGMQVIGKVFGGQIIKSKEIGMTDIECSDKILGNTKTVYQLHGNSVTLPPEFKEIATNVKGLQAFKKNNLYGIQFHPEVRNEHIIINFLKLGVSHD